MGRGKDWAQIWRHSWAALRVQDILSSAGTEQTPCVHWLADEHSESTVRMLRLIYRQASDTEVKFNHLPWDYRGVHE